jgi:phosphatidylserine decarboxylase
METGMRLPVAHGSQSTLLVTGLILMLAVWVRGRLPKPVGALLLALLTPLAALILFFFRDPHRAVPGGDDVVVSPADGEIVAIDRVDEPLHVGGPALRIGIFMSIWDVHVNRAPLAGEVRLVRHVPGQFLQAFRPEAADVNEHLLTGIETGHGPVLVKQIAGILARRCVTYVSVGQHLLRGQRLGLIRFSSRVDLFLPPDAQPTVSLGDRVRAGSSALAHIPAPGEHL